MLDYMSTLPAPTTEEAINMWFRCGRSRKAFCLAHIDVSALTSFALATFDHRVNRDKLPFCKPVPICVFNIGTGFVAQRDRVIEEEPSIRKMPKIVHVRAADASSRQTQSHRIGCDLSGHFGCFDFNSFGFGQQ